MHFQAAVAFLLSAIAANALPAPMRPRDDFDIQTLNATSTSLSDISVLSATLSSISLSASASATVNSTSSATSTGSVDAAQSSASVYSAQASSLLRNLQNEIGAVDPGAYTAYITTIGGRLAVEMSSIGGAGSAMFVTMPTATTDAQTASSTPAPTPNSALASATNRANEAASPPTSLPVVPSSLPSGGPELSSVLSEIASAELNEVTRMISSASKTAELTAYITEVAGTPYVAISSISGSAVTLAATSGVADAFPTTFDGFAVTAIPSRNSATGLTVPRSLLAGVVGALGAVGAGALMIL